MSAILLTKGPISTLTSVRRNWDYVRGMCNADFINAASELQNMGLGTLTNADPANKLQQLVFIKKEPDEVAYILIVNPDLCQVDKYRNRYHQPPSKTISLVLKAKLVTQKLVSEKLLQ